MDIAIIGMAGRFPEAETLSVFYDNLKTGRDSIRPLSAERLEQTAIPFSDHYQSMAWLEGIDQFDHAFFRISLGEARYMDPHQRIALEVVYEALENAGYDPFSFAGSETAVYAGDVSLDYYQLATEYDPTLLTGNLNAVLAGRIARFFDLHGEAVMIDTSCSSSLVAVHHACQTLETGSAEQAIVCGIKIRIFPGEKKPVFDIGIGSEDGKTKSYSSEANGTGSGEAAGCILLKPLERAIADGDIIHAVIKGSAVNQDAARSGSLTAPSSIAQSEVIRKAWKKAGIDPLTVTFIEGHGTATRLGDPIEVEGINLAFSSCTNQKGHCALSSVKSNIGHTDTAAGISGLIKTILSLKNKKLFPAVHFRQPNPFIDFSRSAVFVNTVFRDWETAGGVPRRAGVSAFGLSGTNCHVVLEEAMARGNTVTVNNRSQYMIPLSGFTGKSLRANADCLRNWLAAHPGTSMSALSYTLCAGRPHFPFRQMLLAKEMPALLELLKEDITAPATKSRTELYFVFSHNELINVPLIDLMSKRYPVFASAIATCRKHLDASGKQENNTFMIFSFQFAFYKLLEALHIITNNFLGEGVGELTIRNITGRESLDTAVEQAVAYDSAPVENLEDKCAGFINHIKDKDPVIIELGPVCRITSSLVSLQHIFPLAVCGLVMDVEDPLSGMIRQLYVAGYPLHWEAFFSKDEACKMELPAYTFDRVHCWIREHAAAKPVLPVEELMQDSPGLPAIRVIYDLQDVKNAVSAAWTNVLKQEQIGEDEDFFDIGGHSLNGTQVLNRLKETLGVSLEIDDLFEYGSIATLSGFIFSRLDNVPAKSVAAGIEKAPDLEYYPLTHAQQNFWVLDQLESGLTAYSMPGAYMIRGALDIAAFRQAFKKLVQRHESLRTSFPVVNGEPKQHIGDGSAFNLEIFDLLGMPNNEQYAMQQVKQQTEAAFELQKGLLIKASLYRLENNSALFFFSLHHIIADGWSLEVLIRDVMAFYQSECSQLPAQLPTLTIQFRDYAVWLEKQLSGDNLTIHREFWLQEYKVRPPVLQLPVDFPRPLRQTFNGDKIHTLLDDKLRAGIKELARSNDCTSFMTVLAGINVLLCKITGQYDMVIGSPSSGRIYPGLEDQIGLFLNTMPLRLKREQQESFSDILQSVKNKVLQSSRHQIYPFDSLLYDLSYSKEAGHNSLFDVGFTHNTLEAVAGYGSDAASAPLSELDIEPVSHGFKSVKADLWFHLTETVDQLIISLDYNTDLFLPATIHGFIADIELLFRLITLKPDSSLQQLITSLHNHEQEQKKQAQHVQKQRNAERLANIRKKVDR